MDPQEDEVFASEEQTDKFELLASNSDIMPDVHQRQGVEAIVEDGPTLFEDMDRHTQFQILADISRGMKYITDNQVYHLNISPQYIRKHPNTSSGLLLGWSDAYFYDLTIDEESHSIQTDLPTIDGPLDSLTIEELENSVKSAIGSVMNDIGARKASQVYNMPHRFSFEDIADLLENSNQQI